MERRRAVDVPPRTARVVAVAVLVALVGVLTVGAIGRPVDAVAAVPVAAGILVVQFRFVLASLRRLQTRAWTAAQGVLSFVAVLGLGFSVTILGVWIGGSCSPATAWRPLRRRPRCPSWRPCARTPPAARSTS